MTKWLYEIKDNEIVTSYRTARSGGNRSDFLLTKYENIITQRTYDVSDLLIFILIFSKHNFERIEFLL